MKKKVHFRKKILLFNNRREKPRLTKFNIFLVIIVLVIVFVGISFKVINNYASPILMNYAELEAKKLSSTIMNKAVSKYIIDGINIDELFIITKDSEGVIKTVDFNPIIVNRLLNTTTNTILTNLKYIEQGRIELMDLPENTLVNYDTKKLAKGIIYEIPIGVVFNNPILNNLGPKIPVKLSLIGDIVSNIKTTVTNYGINNALIEVSVSLEITQKVILPVLTKDFRLKLDIPISIKLIQGTVPDYYSGGINQNSPSLSIPIE